jgi:hypothetical protein
MAEKIGTEKISREPGFVYYVDSKGYVGRAARGKKGHKARVSKEAVKRASGYLYYLNSEGYVARTKMARGRHKG